MAEIYHLPKRALPNASGAVVPLPNGPTHTPELERFESESARTDLAFNVINSEEGIAALNGLGYDTQELSERLTQLFADVQVFNAKLPPPADDGQRVAYHFLPPAEVQEIAELEGRGKALYFDVKTSRANAVRLVDLGELVAELDLMVEHPRELFVTRANANKPKHQRVIAFARNPRFAIQDFEIALQALREAIARVDHLESDRRLEQLHVVRELHEAAKFDFGEYFEVLAGGKSLDLPAAPAAG